MTEKDIRVELSALTGYVTRANGLADDVRDVAGARLAAHRSLPADLLGDLGDETGLHGVLAAHIAGLHDHMHALADAVGSLGTAVGGAHADYEIDEQAHAQTFRRLQD